jgi:hypothetical protein
MHPKRKDGIIDGRYTMANLFLYRCMCMVSLFLIYLYFIEFILYLPGPVIIIFFIRYLSGK